MTVMGKSLEKVFQVFLTLALRSKASTAEVQTTTMWVLALAFPHSSRAVVFGLRMGIIRVVLVSGLIQVRSS